MEELRGIRDLINSGPLHRVLLSDRPKWNRLCDALDAMTDAPELGGRLSALDDLRQVVGLDASRDGDVSEAAIVAGIEAVRIELQTQANAHRQSFADGRLSPHLAEDKNLEYALEKVAMAIFGFLPGKEHLADEGTRALGRGGLDVLERAVRGVDSGLAERGFDEWVRSPCSDLLYVIDRLRLLLTGAATAPVGRDASLLATKAIPTLLEDLRALTKEVDGDYDQPDEGWSSAANA